MYVLLLIQTRMHLKYSFNCLLLQAYELLAGAAVRQSTSSGKTPANDRGFPA